MDPDAPAVMEEAVWRIATRLPVVSCVYGDSPVIMPRQQRSSPGLTDDYYPRPSFV